MSRAFESSLACQHFIFDWLGKLKPNKLSTGCQNELKGVAVEKATNPGRQFLFLCLFACFCGFAAQWCSRQSRYATQAIPKIENADEFDLELTIVTSLPRDIYSDRPKNNIIITFSLCVTRVL